MEFSMDVNEQNMDSFSAYNDESDESSLGEMQYIYRVNSPDETTDYLDSSDEMTYDLYDGDEITEALDDPDEIMEDLDESDKITQALGNMYLISILDIEITETIVRRCAKKLNIGTLCQNAAEDLAEDSNYRVRSGTAAAIQLMRHCRRESLTAEDIKEGFASSGMGNTVYNGGSGNLERNVVGLQKASNKIVGDLKECEQFSYHGQWIEFCTYPSCDLLTYYKLIIQAILGSDDTLSIIALNDLKRNPNILPLVPFFVHFTSVGIKKMGNSLDLLHKYLQTIHCLILNPNLYIGHFENHECDFKHESESYLTTLISSVLYCAVEPMSTETSNSGNHWFIRDLAACVLSEILKEHCVSSPKIYNATLLELKTTFQDVSKPFCSHYGAIASLISIGVSALKQVIPLHFSSYSEHLSRSLKCNSLLFGPNMQDAYMVQEKLLLACQLLMQDCSKDVHKKIGPEIDVYLALWNQDYINAFLEYFGDSLASRLPLVEIDATRYYRSISFFKKVIKSLQKGYKKNRLEIKKELENLFDEASEGQASQQDFLFKVPGAPVSCTKVIHVKENRNKQSGGQERFLQAFVSREPCINIKEKHSLECSSVETVKQNCKSKCSYAKMSDFKTFEFYKKLSIYGKMRQTEFPSNKAHWLNIGNLRVFL